MKQYSLLLDGSVNLYLTPEDPLGVFLFCFTDLHEKNNNYNWRTVIVVNSNNVSEEKSTYIYFICIMM